MAFIATHLARVGILALSAVAVSVDAQTVAAPQAAAPLERAQHDADKVFEMIRQHADKPRRTARGERKTTGSDLRGASAPTSARAVAAPTAVPRSLAGAADARLSTSTPPALLGEPVAAGDTGFGETTPAPGAAPAVAVALPRSLRLELVSSVEPEFPAGLVRSLGSGSVLVTFEVAPNGTVARTQVVRSSHQGLNAAAVDAVAAWRFRPTSQTLPGVVELKFE
jgi:TonB family protein